MKSYGFGSPEGINVTIDIPPTMHNEEDIGDPGLSLLKIEYFGTTNCLYEDTRTYILVLASYGEFELPLCNSVGIFEAKPKVGFIKKYLDLTLVSGSTMIEARNQGNPSLEGERRPKRWKCIKKWRIS
jgi:hypothetical protein